jgi:hypothetical protein
MRILGSQQQDCGESDGSWCRSSFALTPHLLAIRAIPLSRLSATLSPAFTLPYTGSFLFIINLCTPSYEPLRHNLPSHPPRCPLSLFALNLALPLFICFIFCIHPSITWLQQCDSQNRPRRAFSAIILLTGQSHSLSFHQFPVNIDIDITLCSRQSAWGGTRSSPSFSPSPNNARLPNGPPPATSAQAASFPPLGPSTPTPRQDHKAILQSLAGLTVRIIFHLTVACPRCFPKGDDHHPPYQDCKTLRGYYRFHY